MTTRYDVLVNGYVYRLLEGEEDKLFRVPLANDWLAVEPISDPLCAPVGGEYVQLAQVLAYVSVEVDENAHGETPGAADDAA